MATFTLRRPRGEPSGEMQLGGTRVSAIAAEERNCCIEEMLRNEGGRRAIEASSRLFLR